MRLPSLTADQTLGPTSCSYTTKSNRSFVKSSALINAAFGPSKYEWDISEWDVYDENKANEINSGYQRILDNMRKFVREGKDVAKNETISINRKNNLGEKVSATLTFSDNNFEVTKINDKEIDYNYSKNLPKFDAADLPSTLIPASSKNADQNQKDKIKTVLLYLFPEAARSSVIQEAMESAMKNENWTPDTDNGTTVILKNYEPLVKMYQHTCKEVKLDPAHPARQLTCADYCQFVKNNRQPGTPDREAVNKLCKCNL